MRIVIDLQGAQGENRTRGIGRYSLNFAQSLSRLRGEHEVVVALNGALTETIEPLRAAFAQLLPPENIVVYSIPQPVAHEKQATTDRKYAAHILREAFIASLNPDWIVVTSLFEGLTHDTATSVGRSSKQRTAVVIYDLIPLIHQTTYLTNDHLRSWYFEKIDNLRRADLLLAISESSGREPMDHLGFNPGNVVNISTAADKHFKHREVTSIERDALGKKYGLSRPFVMYTGGIDRRKNVEGLTEAWSLLPLNLRHQYQLAVVCGLHAQDRERLGKFARKCGLDETDIVFTGFVPDDHLLGLYNACELFVFPSWHEGFGLPVLEAMQCGKPVLASNRSSLPEVAGREDALFDPFDTQDIARKIERALTDSDWRHELARHSTEHAKKFSWEETARRTWKALEDRLSIDHEHVSATLLPASARPKLAYISPLPPERSGISDYSAELLRDLTRWYEIDVIAKQPNAVMDEYVHATCGIRSVEDFSSHAKDYDRVLYHFGNSEFHEHMFELLESYPGVVVLHDFYISGIQGSSEANGWRRDAWRKAVLAANGYQAVLERENAESCEINTWDSLNKYPANINVLQQATGIIVHSQFTRRLGQLWYGEDTGLDWAVIPHLRAPEVTPPRVEARRRLGLAEDALVVCSFGLLGETKLNHRLLEAWLESRLANEAKAHLVFVGEAVGSYGARMKHSVHAAKVAGHIEITGWVDAAYYRDWLASADIAVQVRSHSRGETSGAVLDCMSFGLATITNAHGSMAELDREATRMLPDDFSNTELINALENLALDTQQRRNLGAKARESIRTLNNPRFCAEQYFISIEQFYRRAELGALGAIQRLSGTPSSYWPEIAACLARNHPPRPRRKQILVDISEIVLHDARTGIQRVVRAILKEWLENPPAGFLVEPVYAMTDAHGYRYARRFTLRFLGISDGWSEDDPVEAWEGDVFIGLDLQHHVVSFQETCWQEWRRRGVKVGFVIYDLLPLLLPKYFVKGADRIHAQWLASIARSDQTIAISRVASKEFRSWLEEQNPQRATPLQLGWFHLGADSERSKPSLGVPIEAEKILERFRSVPSFLMVGTIEPRKGHAQTLAAFEALWRDEHDINLVFVGKKGWMVDDLVETLQHHPEKDNHLYWLQDISDEYLDKVYSSSTCFIMASEGEGFGLPIIEAARHGLPILARDIPVFREVSQEFATYFPDELDPHVIADACCNWLDKHRKGQHIRPEGMPFLTWKESANQLIDCLLNNARCETWSTHPDEMTEQ
ncbi:MAG: glycosyltransferase [Pseudomonadota bacterium]